MVLLAKSQCSVSMESFISIIFNFYIFSVWSGLLDIQAHLNFNFPAGRWTCIFLCPTCFLQYWTSSINIFPKMNVEFSHISQPGCRKNSSFVVYPTLLTPFIQRLSFLNTSINVRFIESLIKFSNRSLQLLQSHKSPLHCFSHLTCPHPAWQMKWTVHSWCAILLDSEDDWTFNQSTASSLTCLVLVWSLCCCLVSNYKALIAAISIKIFIEYHEGYKSCDIPILTN